MDENAHEFSGGFVPIIRADGDVSLREGGALAIVAGGNATITEGGTGALVAGGNVTMRDAGAGNMFIGGKAELNQAGVGQVFAVEAQVADSKIGVLLAASASLENSEIVLGTRQAMALGAAIGVVLFSLGRLFHRS